MKLRRLFISSFFSFTSAQAIAANKRITNKRTIDQHTHIKKKLMKHKKKLNRPEKIENKSTKVQNKKENNIANYISNKT